MSNGTNPPRKRGCLFYGCLSFIGLGVVVIVTVLLAYYFTKRWALRTVSQYTDTGPATFEQVTYSPAERDDLRRRLASFAEAVERGTGGQELVLTASDLNVLLSENADYKDRLFVIIEDDRVKGRVSLPLDEVIPAEFRERLSALRGRYLNGSATFRVALEGGTLDVRLEELEARGRPLDKIPLFGRVFADLKKRNLAAEMSANSQWDTNAISRWDSLQIRDGKVILRSKAVP